MHDDHRNRPPQHESQRQHSGGRTRHAGERCGQFDQRDDWLAPREDESRRNLVARTSAHPKA